MMTKCHVVFWIGFWERKKGGRVGKLVESE